MTQLAIFWWGLHWSFVDNGGTRKTIFLATYFNPKWTSFASQVCIGTINILADGLLVSTTFTLYFKFSRLKLEKVWRCFYAWDQSLLATSFPLFFLVAETGEISFERTRSPNRAN